MVSLDIKLRRTTTAQQVADGLSELIMSGRFGPGTRLRESAIATELGVSRNTVREAVRVLQLGGLIRHEVNRGAVVITPTTESVQALYGARATLEVAAARGTVPVRNALDPVRRALERLYRAVEALEVPEIVTADLAFHSAIVAMLGNNRIDDFYAELTRELRFYLTILSVEDRESANLAALIGDHAAILDALTSGDRDRAVRAIGAHIEQNARRVCDILETRGASPG